MQTKPSCSLDNYGIIDFYNFTDTHKTAYVQRLYSGKVIEDLVYAVRPRTIVRLRFPPGYYYLAATLEDGRTLRTRNPILLQTCETENYVMKYKKPTDPKDKKIRPRRQNELLEFYWSTKIKQWLKRVRRISGILQEDIHT
jgi:hypothetical protein